MALLLSFLFFTLRNMSHFKENIVIIMKTPMVLFYAFQNALSHPLYDLILHIELIIFACLTKC